jgi:hypothetical protein
MTKAFLTQPGRGELLSSLYASNDGPEAQLPVSENKDRRKFFAAVSTVIDIYSLEIKPQSELHNPGLIE